MSLNIEIDPTYSVDSEVSLANKFLKLNRLRSETIQNSKTRSELDLIYLKDSVILQIKRKNKPVETYYGFDFKAAKRIKSAWEWEAESELIAIASASANSLFVMGCDLQTWEIPFKTLSCLEQVLESEKTNFEVDEDGSYLYWKQADIHVDYEELKAAVNPKFKEQLLLNKLEYSKAFGKAIATVRKANKLNQAAIDGISDRHLRRIENEGQQPTLDVLKKLAKSHGLDLEDYLDRVNQAIKINRSASS